MARGLRYRTREDRDDIFIIETAKAEMDDVLLEAWGRPVDPTEILNVEGTELVIIEDDSGRQIGFYSILRPEQTLYLNTIVLAGEAQNKGYGRGVMNHLEEIARKEHRQAFELSVQTTNPRAIRFYEKLGFENQGWIFYNTILMRKDL